MEYQCTTNVPKQLKAFGSVRIPTVYPSRIICSHFSTRVRIRVVIIIKNAQSRIYRAKKLKLQLATTFHVAKWYIRVPEASSNTKAISCKPEP